MTLQKWIEDRAIHGFPTFSVEDVRAADLCNSGLPIPPSPQHSALRNAEQSGAWVNRRKILSCKITNKQRKIAIFAISFENY